MNKISTFNSKISQVLQIYERIAIITQIWHRAKLYCTCISSAWYLIMVLNMNKINHAIMEECTRTARQTDRQTDGLDWNKLDTNWLLLAQFQM